MAAKGGGAWKVAYADFVTAMMAFFLVMWLTAQNQEIKRSVADYFSDPLGSMEASSDRKKPSRNGSVMEFLQTGTVPAQEKVAMGKGRRSHSPARDFSPATKMVSDWLHFDKPTNAYWMKQASDQRAEARWAADVQEKRKSEKQFAVEKLAAQLKEEVISSLPVQTDGLYRNLLTDALKDVNWREIAEEFVGP